jgi:hypothetical protein
LGRANPSPPPLQTFVFSIAAAPLR